MRIRLVRHGIPEFDTGQKIQGTEFHKALDSYAKSSVTIKPTTTVFGPVPLDPTYIVLSSDLQRAKCSASLLNLDIQKISPLLNEARLPHPNNLPFPVSWNIALVALRSVWFLGYKKNAEGIRKDLQRAELAANWLVNMARQHEDVIVFGHGIMHHLIYRKLLAQGWSSEWSSGKGHWSCRVVQCAVV